MKLIMGDLVQLAFDGEFDVIIQGCNCFCRMENGLARIIRDRCPEAHQADMKTTPGERSKLGTYTSAEVLRHGRTFTVVNAYIQFERRRGVGEDLVEYDALRTVLRTVRQRYHTHRIGIPLIGAGIAAGKWSWIERIILEELFDCDVTIVHYEPDFFALFEQLEEETKISSNASDVIKTEAGSELLEYGALTMQHMFKAKVPLTAHTMYLLGELAGENPISDDDAGHIDRMAAAWQRWAARHHY